MRTISMILTALLIGMGAWSCQQQEAGEAEVKGMEGGGGQATVQDDVSEPDIVKVAVGSPDHKTLVAALKAADLVNVLSNNGPFTVFAPTDAAFGKLPAGTVEDLVKPENKEKLSNILYHHVQVSVYDLDRLKSSTQLMMFDGKAEEIRVEGNDVYVGGARILGSVKAANGIVHVVDAVILAD